MIPERAGCAWHNFLPSSQLGAVVWVCTGSSADKPGMFLKSLSGAYPEPRPFLPLALPTGDLARGAQRGQLTPTDKGIFRTVGRDAQQ